MFKTPKDDDVSGMVDANRGAGVDAGDNGQLGAADGLKPCRLAIVAILRHKRLIGIQRPYSRPNPARYVNVPLLVQGNFMAGVRSAADLRKEFRQSPNPKEVQRNIEFGEKHKRRAIVDELSGDEHVGLTIGGDAKAPGQIEAGIAERRCEFGHNLDLQSCNIADGLAVNVAGDKAVGAGVFRPNVLDLKELA